MNAVHAFFCSGVFALLLFSQLPSLPLMLLIVLSGCILSALLLRTSYRRGALCCIAFLVGLLWVYLHAYWHSGHQLPENLEKKPLQVVGVVTAMPKENHLGVRFILKVEQWQGDAAILPGLPRKILLNWYQYPPVIQAGQRWQLNVRLKRPNGLANQGGFDYEKWLYSEGVHALGYVAKGDNRLLADARGGYQIWRYQLVKRLQQQLDAVPRGGMIGALITGERDKLADADYQILTATGTSHLMAISGLHVGLISGLFYWIVNVAWRVWPRCCLIFPAPLAGATAAILTALLYSAVAGFSTPTLRALIMITCLMVCLLLKRSLTLTDRLLFACVLVLLLNPLVILSISFWLSFIAVATVVYVGQYHYRYKINQALLLQWRVSIALMPVTLVFFQQTSLISAVCNLFAIPWVGFVVLPSAFIASIAMFIYTPIADGLFWFASINLQWCWKGLATLASLPWHSVYFPLPKVIIIVCLLVATVILLSPKKMPGKWLSLCWCCPLFFYSVESLPIGSVKVTALDVGQGLGMIVQTQNHTLVFDTGPGWHDSFDAGASVINPYLKHAHRTHVDTVMISHGDMDHIGGLDSVMQANTVDALISNELIARYEQTTLCRRDQQWQWDGVRFKILSPTADYSGTRNNRSCVLMIDNGHYKMLLTGDIEKQAEKKLVQYYGRELSADVLVAAHHGSRTSSHPAFVSIVAPQWVIYPIGYLNRFRFPAKDTVNTYNNYNVQQLSTSNYGSLTFTLNFQPEHITWISFRQWRPKFWRKPVK